MTPTTTRLTLACLLTTGLGLSGCYASTDESEAAAIGEALELDSGGLTLDDELPAFGLEEDLAELELLGEDPLYPDAMSADAEVLAMTSAPDAVRYRVAVVWGQIPGDRDNDSPREWSGVLGTNRGAVIVDRTLRFDGGFDRVLPRRDPQRVAFTSVTRPHHDGLALTIVDPDPASDVPLTLGYLSDLPGPLGAEGGLHHVPVRDLLAGPVELAADDAGNRMIAVAHARPVDACDHGFLMGKWHRVREGRGRFVGRVVGEHGGLRGHVRGIYGVRESGEQVFFGKYIRADGTFAGIFRGRYADGRFEGRWVNRGGDVGALGGRYREGIPGPETGGHFLGRWAETSCDIRM